MSNDRRLGVFVAVLSLAVATLTGAYAIFTGGNLPLTVFGWPASGFILGVTIIFSSIVQNGLKLEDEIEQFPDLIEDDIRDLRSGDIRPPHVMLVITCAAALLQAGLMLWFGKIYASWGPFNVLIVALLAIALVLVWSIRSDWFQVRRSHLSTRVYLIPAIGWLICILIGIGFAEPREYGGVSRLERSQTVTSEEYQGLMSSGDSYVFWRTAGSAGEAISDFDCDDEGCLVVLLVVIIVVAVLASATIPHFWVVATMLLLTLMGVITMREILYTDGDARYT